MKYLSRWPFPLQPSLFYKAEEIFLLSLVGGLSKLWVTKLNRCKTQNLSDLSKFVLRDGKESRPLVTVANHHSCIDDPALFGLLPFRLLTRPSLLRWTPGADEIIFYNKFNRIFFGFGRVVPTIRGTGVYQKGIDFCVEKLNEGGWVHLFSEGKVNMDHRLMKMKWGICRLVEEAKVTPIVLPFWHIGMDDVLPNRKPYIPRVGKRITFVVGSPIDFRDRLEEWISQNLTKVEIRRKISLVIQKEINAVKETAEKLHLST